jgi:lysophospholipid acyltransferase (LPLAT)-like uncharacterized protein
VSSGEVKDALGYGHGRILLVYWIADGVAVGFLPFLDCVFEEAARAIRFLYDDTFWGRVCARFHGRLGGCCTILAPKGTAARLSQIRSLMGAPASYALAIDGGGPYRVVGTGLSALAAALDASIVPIAVATRPAMVVARRSGVRLPLPAARVAVAIGDHISVTRDANRCGITADVMRALNALAVLAAGILFPQTDRRRCEIA